MLSASIECFTLQQKIKIDSQITLKSGKKSCNYSNIPKQLYRSGERCHGKLFNQFEESGPFDPSKNYTLDFTSPNSTTSARTFDIIQKSSTTDTVTERKIEPMLTEEFFFSKMSTKKPQRIFCKDPNKRLKNLFTIVRPSENLNKNSNFPDGYDIESLSKTKELLVKLIDKELERVQPDDGNTNEKPHPDKVIDSNVLKKLKLECMRKIEDELRIIKRLENC